MNRIPAPDEQTRYSSRRQDDLDTAAFPALGVDALSLLHSVGEVFYPAAGEILWEAGGPYDFYLILSGAVLLVDRRDDRVVFVVEEGDFVGELGAVVRAGTHDGRTGRSRLVSMGKPTSGRNARNGGNGIRRTRLGSHRRLPARQPSTRAGLAGQSGDSGTGLTGRSVAGGTNAAGWARDQECQEVAD